MSLLDLLDGRFGFSTLAGIAFMLLGVTTLASGNTVLDQQGIKPAGSCRRRLSWADVVAVQQSRMALHYQDIELTVRGQHEPLRLKERNGGDDFKAVHEAWLSRRTENAPDEG